MIKLVAKDMGVFLREERRINYEFNPSVIVKKSDHFVKLERSLFGAEYDDIGVYITDEFINNNTSVLDVKSKDLLKQKNDILYVPGRHITAYIRPFICITPDSSYIKGKATYDEFAKFQRLVTKEPYGLICENGLYIIKDYNKPI